MNLVSGGVMVSTLEGMYACTLTQYFCFWKRLGSYFSNTYRFAYQELSSLRTFVHSTLYVCMYIQYIFQLQNQPPSIMYSRAKTTFFSLFFWGGNIVIKTTPNLPIKINLHTQLRRLTPPSYIPQSFIIICS